MYAWGRSTAKKSSQNIHYRGPESRSHVSTCSAMAAVACGSKLPPRAMRAEAFRCPLRRSRSGTIVGRRSGAVSHGRVRGAAPAFWAARWRRFGLFISPHAFDLLVPMAIAPAPPFWHPARPRGWLRFAAKYLTELICMGSCSPQILSDCEFNLFGPLLNQKLGGFASYYFIVYSGVGGGGPRRKNPEIFTNPRLDSPIGNFAASYSRLRLAIVL